MMQALSTLNSANAGRYVSTASGKGATATEEAAPAAAGDEASISAQPEAGAKPSKSRMGALGKLGCVLALGGLLTATTGCAVHSGYHYDPYSGTVHSQSTGVTPDGRIITQQTRTGPYGTTTQTDQIGPYGVQRDTQHSGPWGYRHRTEGVGPGGYYRYDNGYPVWVPAPVQRGPICRPMTWFDPGGCY
jgi:hypothetical protein